MISGTYTCMLATRQFTVLDRLLMKYAIYRNKALDDLNKWCMANSSTPQEAKCEAMLFYRGSFIGPYPVVTIGNETISWVCHARLHVTTIHHKKAYVDEEASVVTDLKNNLSTSLTC